MRSGSKYHIIMKVTFAIKYRAEVGQELSLVGLEKRASLNEQQRDITLERQNEELWLASAEFDNDSQSFTYSYQVRSSSDSKILRQETGTKHSFVLEGNTKLYREDAWTDRTNYYYRYTEAFASILYPQKLNIQKSNSDLSVKTENALRLNLEVFVPPMSGNYRVYLMGEGETFGQWQTARALALNNIDKGLWHLSINIRREELERESFAFKFVLINQDNGDLIWEEGENRVLNLPHQLNDYDNIAFTGLVARLPKELFHKEKFAGVVIPLFALRSKQDYGIGDFASLKLAINWVKESKMKVLQLLPINDTTFYRDWRDSYPYNAISVKALHPIYLDLQDLEPIQDKTLRKRFAEDKKALHKCEQVDYPKVLAYKEAYLKQHYTEQRNKIQADQAFLTFIKNEEKWLKPYVAYCLLRDKYFPLQKLNKWQGFESYRAKDIESLFAQIEVAEWQYYAYLQYLLDRQMREIRAYASSCGVLLKGDIPIGVAPHSVDVWAEPHLFNQEMSAGAPPDDFALEGQNWGFPTYNWDEMRADGYAWWRGRLQHMQRYFSAYRIDHILGFFRIWEVPRSKKSALLGHFSPALPLNQAYWESKFPNQAFKQLKEYALVQSPKEQGHYHPRIAFDKTELYKKWTKQEQEQWQELKNDYFYKRHNELWRVTAKERLEALLNSSEMLACAEDLGMLADSVPEVLSELEILSLDLERMPKTIAQTQWTNIKQLPYLSICTTSTHDMPSLRAWWKNLSKEEQKQYIRLILREDSSIINNKTKLFTAIIRNHLRASSVAVILPFADYLSFAPKLSKQEAEEEQINHPDNPNQKWCYRMPFAIDSQAKGVLDWQEQVAQIIQEEGRY